jgi:hypothetical protein
MTAEIDWSNLFSSQAKGVNVISPSTGKFDLKGYNKTRDASNEENKIQYKLITPVASTVEKALTSIKDERASQQKRLYKTKEIKTIKKRKPKKSVISKQAKHRNRRKGKNKQKYKNFKVIVPKP